MIPKYLYRASVRLADAYEAYSLSISRESALFLLREQIQHKKLAGHIEVNVYVWLHTSEEGEEV